MTGYRYSPIRVYGILTCIQEVGILDFYYDTLKKPLNLASFQLWEPWKLNHFSHLTNNLYIARTVFKSIGPIMSFKYWYKISEPPCWHFKINVLSLLFVWLVMFFIHKTYKSKYVQKYSDIKYILFLSYMLMLYIASEFIDRIMRLLSIIWTNGPINSINT